MLKREAIKAASDTADAYIQNWTRFVIGWEEIHRGRMNASARCSSRAYASWSAARRSTIHRTWPSTIDLDCLLADSYAEALEYSEQSLAVAVTPLGSEQLRLVAKDAPWCCFGELMRARQLLEEDRRRFVADGDLYRFAGTDGMIGVCKVLRGNIAEGIHLLEEAISRREREGYRDCGGLVSPIFVRGIFTNHRGK